MQKNLKNRIKSHFTIIPNSLINDRNLSDRARFIFTLMASKPDDWKFYNSSLAKELGYHEDTLRKYVSELIESGWLVKHEAVGKPNIYTLQPTKFSESEKLRHRDSPTPKNPDTYKEGLSTNKDLKQRSKSNKKKDYRAKTNKRKQSVNNVNNSVNNCKPELNRKRKSNKKKDDISLKTNFEKARKAYPGQKRGLDTEFDYFKQKVKDWKEVLPELKPAIEQQKQYRQKQESAGNFVPAWKHFKSWIYNRYWEMEFEQTGSEGIKPVERDKDGLTPRQRLMQAEKQKRKTG